MAPIAEELVFRGLLEGYLLETAGFMVGILVPAILFTIMHIAPFKRAPKDFLSLILLSAFSLSIIVGTLRFISNSIIPAILTHMIFNVSGRIVSNMQNE